MGHPFVAADDTRSLAGEMPPTPIQAA